MMRSSDETLERLISRCLDREDAPEDRRELRVRLKADPAARALLDEYRAIDEQVRDALHCDMRPRPSSRSNALWYRAGRVLALAAAACIAAMICLTPRALVRPEPHAGRTRHASLFATPDWSDALEARRPVMERPHVRHDDLRCDWIMIPTDGGIMVVEINRLDSRLRAIHEDF